MGEETVMAIVPEEFSLGSEPPGTFFGGDLLNIQ